MVSLESPRTDSFKVPYHDVVYFHDYFQDKRERPNSHHIVTWRWSTPEEEEIAWPTCAIPGCRNKSCLRLHSKFCHPHTLLSELRPYWNEDIFYETN